MGIRSYLRASYALPVLGTVAVVLALVGWVRQGTGLGDAVFKTLGVLSAGGSYDEAGKWPGNLWLEVARWFGLAFFLLTAKKAFGLMLSRQVDELAAKWRPHEVVLVGDHSAFDDLSSAITTKQSVLWIATYGGRRRRKPRTIPADWTPDLIRRFRLTRAQTVVVGYRDDDMQALDVARRFGDCAGGHDVLLISGELATHEGLQSSPDLRKVRLISPERAIARGLHAAHPPFAIARELKQERIHALFIGMGETGEQILRDLIQSSLTSFLAKPRITIVDPRATEILASLHVRVPELNTLIDVEALSPLGVADARALPVDNLIQACEAVPFTLAYICLREDTAALACAFALERLAAQMAWPLGAIFFRQRSTRAAPPAASEPSLANGVTAFGTTAQLAEGLGLLGQAPDSLARSLHEAYRSFAASEDAAALPWEGLSEDLREANRAVYMHVPAKLASAGVDLNPAADELQRLLDDPGTLERLAELEHARWMAQRRLAGWRQGVPRDNRRRLHPDLVPFNQLPETAREKDREMVRTLIAVLLRREGAPL